MKRCALSLLLACLGLTALLLAAGCTSRLREPVRSTDRLPGVIEAEIWSDHWHYDFGEPVRVRVTLKNVSREIQILGGKGENEGKPAVDILMRGGIEDYWWSQAYPDKVKNVVTLKPGKAYVVEWVVTPTLQAQYGFTAWWADPRPTGFRNDMGFAILYGVEPPGPLP